MEKHTQKYVCASVKSLAKCIQITREPAELDETLKAEKLVKALNKKLIAEVLTLSGKFDDKNFLRSKCETFGQSVCDDL